MEIAVKTDEAPREMLPTFPPRISAFKECHAEECDENRREQGDVTNS